MALDMGPRSGLALHKPEKRSTTKRRKRRVESVVKQRVRAECVERDGDCRIATGREDRRNWTDGYPCSGESEWMPPGREETRENARASASDTTHNRRELHGLHKTSSRLRCRPVANETIERVGREWAAGLGVRRLMAGHDNWLTPPDLLHLLDREFAFDLDASASAGHEKCERFITPDEDALKTPWKARAVWCNPPYSLIGKFVYRAWEQCQAHRNTIVLLIPAYTDPAYWYDCIVPYADEIRFLCGRVSFLENGARKTSARFPSVIIVFRWRAGEMKKPPHIWWWKWRNTPNNGEQKGKRQWAVRAKQTAPPLFVSESDVLN